jgi:hypothetical protein
MDERIGAGLVEALVLRGRLAASLEKLEAAAVES